MSGQTALVTGASSGIGAEIALELAARGCSLILSGRDPSRLAETAARVRGAGASAETIAADLSRPEGASDLLSHIGDRQIDILVNNAGFGYDGEFADMDTAAIADMIAVNVTTLSILTRALLPGMLERHSGRILNVASTAAFSPCPHMAVYGATKAYVLSFTEALATEIKGSGVTATALCPGATDTRFAETASMDGTGLFRRSMSPGAVAKRGTRALLNGRRTVVIGFRNLLLAFSTRLAPRSVAAAVAGEMLRKR